MKLITFDHIAGVPVHYARFTRAQYGTRGKGPRKVRLEENFHKELEACFHDLWDICHLGKPEVFVSGGCYVQKAGKHGEGRGVDIDSFHWADRDFVTLNYPNDERFYLAVESVLRMWFGTVLQYEYNRAHRDHFHVDNGSPVGFFPKSRSRVLFVQACLTHIYERPVDIDGRYGSHTQANVREVLSELGIGGVGIPLSSRWDKFLHLTAIQGFGEPGEPK